MSWQQLKAIADTQRQQALEEKALAAIVCPNDGAIMQQHPVTKEMACPMGDYRTFAKPPQSRG